MLWKLKTWLKHQCYFCATVLLQHLPVYAYRTVWTDSVWMTWVVRFNPGMSQTGTTVNPHNVIITLLYNIKHNNNAYCFDFKLKSLLVQKYINNQPVHFNIYELFYSQCSHQRLRPVTWPWRWPDYRPKHVGENTVNVLAPEFYI